MNPLDVLREQACTLLDSITNSATDGVIEFLRDDSNREALEGLRFLFGAHRQLDRHQLLRSTVLGYFGVIPLKPGAKMGLMVRFMELGLHMVDWDQVITELQLD